MIDYLGSVKEFHKRFACSTSKTPKALDFRVAVQRLRLISEEVAELTEAIAKRDLVETADALADLLYVTFGTAVAAGIPMDEVFKQVHESNMTKLGGHHDDSGKFVKPASYKPVHLEWLLIYKEQ